MTKRNECRNTVPQMLSLTTCVSWTWCSISTRQALSHIRHEPKTDTATQVYAILDEIFLAGEIEETSKEVVLSRLDELEKLE